MKDSHADREGRLDSDQTASGNSEAESLWRQAEDIPLPFSEKLAHVLFGVTALLFYFFGSNESSPFVILFLWLVSLSATRYRRQQTQINALRELLRRERARL